MDYRLEYRKGSLPMAVFREMYQDRERFIDYCRECPRYDTVWSCHPLDFDTDEYLEKFAWVNVLGAKVILNTKVIEEADTAEKVMTVGWEIVSAVKLVLEEKMRQMERQISGGVSLSSGGCNLCKECIRKEGKSCRMPEKMRYSLDAFGFDLSAITKDMLGIDILWCRDRLPEYFTLIHGLLSKEEVPEATWDSMGLSFVEGTMTRTELDI